MTDFMKNLKKVAELVCCLMIITVASTGCASKTNESPSNSTNAPSISNTSNTSNTETTEAVSTEPTEISILTDYYSKTAPDGNNVVQKEIEKQSNTKLNIVWVPNSGYNDKLNLTLASGDIPDLTFVLEPHSSAMRNYYSQGLYYDLTDSYKNYKNLAGMGEAPWNNSKAPDGKNYIIPRPRPSEGGSTNFILRADLLEDAGLSAPKTMDDFYNMLKTLTKSNPGFVGFLAGAASSQTSPGFEIEGLLSCFTMTNGQWKAVDGNLVYIDLLPEMKDGLAYVNKLYKEKLINEDFAVTKDLKPIANSGKFIAMVGGNISDNWIYQQEATKVDPNVKLQTLVSLNGFCAKQSGMFGGYGIYRGISEDKMKKVLEFMDFMVNPESGGELCTYGIEGVHYTMENGLRKGITEAIARDNIGGNTFGQIGTLFDQYARAGSGLADIPADMLENNKKILDARVAISIPNPLDMGLFSSTGDLLFSEYNKKSADFKLKIILGIEPLSNWDTYVNNLKADHTFTKAMAELSESYKGKIGK